LCAVLQAQRRRFISSRKFPIIQIVLHVPQWGNAVDIREALKQILAVPGFFIVRCVVYVFVCRGHDQNGAEKGVAQPSGSDHEIIKKRQQFGLDGVGRGSNFIQEENAAAVPLQQTFVSFVQGSAV
jgi:hypothetical protein